MKILTFTDINNTINVSYKTDIVNDTQDNFHVLSITGLDDNERKLGLNFQQLPYYLNLFKQFALTHGLKLTVTNLNGQHSVSTLVDYTTYYNNGGLGLDNL